MEKVKVFLSDGSSVWMNYSLEGFINEYLDEKGHFNTGTIGFTNEVGVSTLLFTNQIVGIEEIK